MRVMKRILKIALLFFIVLTALVLIFILVNRLLGFNPHVVISNSMSPKLSKGDIIYIKKAEAEDLAVGDIITVRPMETNYTVTHRIAELHMDEGYIYVEGDQNDSGERVLLGVDEIVGVYVYHVPWIGIPALPKNSAE